MCLVLDSYGACRSYLCGLIPFVVFLGGRWCGLRTVVLMSCSSEFELTLDHFGGGGGGGGG